MIAVETLRGMLAGELESVGRSLLGNPRLDHSGELRGEDRRGELWVLQTTGRKKGVCLNATTMKGANAFDFLRVAGGDLSIPAACRLAEGLLGLSEHDPARLPALVEQARQAQAFDAEAREADDARRAARTADRAREWRGGAPIGTDSPAAQYLASRCCLADDLHPNLRAADNQSSATMLAGMLNVSTGQTTAFHETSLCMKRGGAGWEKREPKAKLVWGKASGTIIPLATGPAGSLVLSEGIENGLTAHLLLPGVAAAAAYAAGNLRSAGLAAKWDRVILVRDRETNPRSHGPACRAAAIAWWWEQGRAVTCLDPPDGYNDLNAAAVAIGGQRNGPAPSADAVWNAAGPLDTVPSVAAWCAGLGLGEGPHLLRAHPGIEANGRRHPALLAQLVRPDGSAAGLVGLAVGLGTALAAGTAWGVLGLDHLAEAALASSLWSLDLYPGVTPTLADDLLMWREGLRRLHPGRELRVVAAEPVRDAAD
jgi:hypothetical protein